MNTTAMTLAELQTLDDEQLNVMLAELEGFTFHDVKQHKGEDVYEKFWLRPSVQLESITADQICFEEGTSVPRYCSDLNQTARVERDFGMTRNDFAGRKLRRVYEKNIKSLCEDLLFPTARQRTIALIATKKGVR